MVPKILFMLLGLAVLVASDQSSEQQDEFDSKSTLQSVTGQDSRHSYDVKTEETEEFMEDPEVPDRKKRQATFNAMQRSLTNNPVGKPEFGRPTLHGGYFRDMKNFGGRVGGSAGVKVWDSGRSSVGLGAAGAANVGLARGRPYANGPEIGAGIGYQRGPFSATVGVGRQHRGQTTYGLGLGYRFKRSAPGQDNEDDAADRTEEEEEPERQKRQVTSNAMDRSLTNNPVGQPEFRGPSLQGGYFQDKKNFGGRVEGSAGVKVWESGRSSVGLGAAGAANMGLNAGRPYANSPELGAAVGYRRGQFSASAGVGHGFRGRGSNTYGVNFGYRFRRSTEEESHEDSPIDEGDSGDTSQPEEKPSSDEADHVLRKRQISGTAGRAMDKSLTNYPTGRLDHSRGIEDRYFNNRKNFGGTATAGVGTKVWERNNKSVGVGLAVDSRVGLANGRPFASPPRGGVGVGYRQGPFSATVGMDRGRGYGGRYTNNYGVRFSYDFPRGKRDIAEMDE